MSTPAPATGQCLGLYQLVSPIGKGAMGEVWKGRDTRLNHDVAKKFSRAEFPS
jgi:serine/threonine protein kinase